MCSFFSLPCSRRMLSFYPTSTNSASSWTPHSWQHSLCAFLGNHQQQPSCFWYIFAWDVWPHQVRPHQGPASARQEPMIFCMELYHQTTFCMVTRRLNLFWLILDALLLIVCFFWRFCRFSPLDGVAFNISSDFPVFSSEYLFFTCF